MTSPSDPLYGAAIFIPPGATSEAIYFTISTNTTALLGYPLDSTAGAVVSFGPNIEFASAVTIVVPYDPKIAFERKLREAEMGLQTLFESAWVPVTDVTVDIFIDRVYARVLHFSDYTPSGSMTAWGGQW